MKNESALRQIGLDELKMAFLEYETVYLASNLSSILSDLKKKALCIFKKINEEIDMDLEDSQKNEETLEMLMNTSAIQRLSAKMESKTNSSEIVVNLNTKLKMLSMMKELREQESELLSRRNHLKDEYEKKIDAHETKEGYLRLEFQILECNFQLLPIQKQIQTIEKALNSEQNETSIICVKKTEKNVNQPPDRLTRISGLTNRKSLKGKSLTTF